MGGFAPVYPPEEMEKLGVKERDELRLEIMRVLQNDRQIRRLLRTKTLPHFKRLSRKKAKR